MVYRPTTKLCNQNVCFVGERIPELIRTQITELLRQYFPKDYITIGTLGRKILPFLTALTKEFDGTWEAMTYLDKNINIIICWFSWNDRYTFAVRINCTNSSERRSYKQVVHRLFTKDKFYEGEHNTLCARTCIDGKYYIYTKHLTETNSFLLKFKPQQNILLTKLLPFFGKKEKLISVKEGFVENMTDE